ncbi:MAG: hypothetical protein QOG64_3145 [Acidimicrobiaceae bacterium]|nr:hypothetical protein [Acidimicrobiaceae bacterium]
MTHGINLGPIADIVGSRYAITDPDVRARHCVDWTGRFRGETAAVVRPGSTAEVAELLAHCHRHRIAVVPQGGNTGLVGGSVPLHGELVLHLGRLDRMDQVDRLAGQVTAGAGVTLGRLQEKAAGAGFEFGIDLGARDTATVGGMIATNAGGTRLLRFGAMRAQVAGIEAVLADGRIVSHLGGLAKDNTGFDLAGLLTGSEGTLAVVTAARLKLVPLLRERVVALLALGSVTAALEAVAALRGRLSSLDAAEVFFAEGLALVRRAFDLPSPGPTSYPVNRLIACADHVEPPDALAAAVAGLGPLVEDVAVATAAAPRAALWRLREAHTEAINGEGIPHKLDVSLPAAALAEFVTGVIDAVGAVAPAARCYLFGHLGDGNLHVNVVDDPEPPEAVDDAVLRLVASMGGSISAEHGIGSAKRQWLSLNRSQVEIDVFRGLKQALDPHHILNPHVLLPGEGRTG